MQVNFVSRSTIDVFLEATKYIYCAICICLIYIFHIFVYIVLIYAATFFLFSGNKDHLLLLA